MASCYVHSIDRIFHWWYRSTLPRPASVYEYVHHIYALYLLLIVAPSLAFKSRQLCAFQHAPPSTVQRYRQSRRDDPRTVFLHVLHHFCVLVFLPWLHLPGPQCVLMGHLDRPG